LTEPALGLLDALDACDEGIVDEGRHAVTDGWVATVTYRIR
jgi:hypothetical protein